MTPSFTDSPLEVWGGAECTVNRVHERSFDQLRRTGHHDRLSDLDSLATLGLSKLRVPVLWERVASARGGSLDWSWSDRYLDRCREVGIEPIIGLLHHGSGPMNTGLLDPDFPERFADFAQAAAERYHWVSHWTPINEPLTTARFSGLYGHWYPHHRELPSFALALLHQIRAIGLAMRVIRDIVPAAVLVQTEDIGCATSSPALQHQRDYENSRRWWSLDLLMGDRSVFDPLHRALHGNAAGQRLLGDVLAEPTPPSIIGINHYVTSNRHLDDRFGLFPGVPIGGNGVDAYVDVESVRAADTPYAGFTAILEEVWTRYAVPLALTEVQLSCTREEQMRWLAQAWEHATACRSRGIDVIAVTPWALFGSVDWGSLVTRDEGRYEVGAFDARATPARATSLARMIRELAMRGRYEHPVLCGDGWWNRCQAREVERDEPISDRGARERTPILLLGAGGVLGRELLQHCRLRNLEVVCCTRDTVDVSDYASVLDSIAAHRPWAVINAAGFARVQRAESEIEVCRSANEAGAAHVAAACAHADLPLLTFSTHMVFGGERRRAYRENDATGPLNAYARSKRAAEVRVQQMHPRSLIIRSGSFLGATDGRDMLERTVRDLRSGHQVPVACDVTVSPTYLPDLVQTSIDLLIDDARGLWHLCNAGRTTWSQLAYACAERAGMQTGLIRPIGQADLGNTARVPSNSALESNHGRLLPSLDSALDRLFERRALADARQDGEFA